MDIWQTASPTPQRWPPPTMSTWFMNDPLEIAHGEFLTKMFEHKDLGSLQVITQPLTLSIHSSVILTCNEGPFTNYVVKKVRERGVTT